MQKGIPVYMAYFFMLDIISVNSSCRNMAIIHKNMKTGREDGGFPALVSQEGQCHGTEGEKTGDSILCADGK